MGEIREAVGVCHCLRANGIRYGLEFTTSGSSAAAGTGGPSNRGVKPPAAHGSGLRTGALASRRSLQLVRRWRGLIESPNSVAGSSANYATSDKMFFVIGLRQPRFHRCHESQPSNNSVPRRGSSCRVLQAAWTAIDCRFDSSVRSFPMPDWRRNILSPPC